MDKTSVENCHCTNLIWGQFSRPFLLIHKCILMYTRIPSEIRLPPQGTFGVDKENLAIHFLLCLPWFKKFWQRHNQNLPSSLFWTLVLSFYVAEILFPHLFFFFWCCSYWSKEPPLLVWDAVGFQWCTHWWGFLVQEPQCNKNLWLWKIFCRLNVWNIWDKHIWLFVAHL